jgi:hypothetical protein
MIVTVQEEEKNQAREIRAAALGTDTCRCRHLIAMHLDS